MDTSIRNKLLLAGLLVGLMVATRTHHFASPFHLPDASLAVFMLGGIWLGRPAYMALLMAVALLIDVGTAWTAADSRWCLTPAYVGLIPAYATPWLAGRWLARSGGDPFGPGRYAAAGLAAVSLAFVISNAFWYALSGYFGGTGMFEYAGRVARYYPPYLGAALLYLAIAWALHALWRLQASAGPVRGAKGPRR